MKIGILITDAVREELISEHGDYPDMFEDLIAGVDRSIEFTRFYVQSKIPQSVDCDGYLITGSRHSVYDELPWIERLVDFIKEQELKGKSKKEIQVEFCLLYTSPSPRDQRGSGMGACGL